MTFIMSSRKICLSLLAFVCVACQQNQKDIPIKNLSVVALEEAIFETSQTEALEAQGLFSWRPTGARKHESVPECRAQALKAKIKEATSIHEFTSTVQSFFTLCENELLEGSRIGLINNLIINGARYDVSQNHLIKTNLIHFNTGEKIRSFFAFKPDDKPRPLIIARCGVFCSIGNTVPLVMLMHLFDETPFHVVILPSTSGQDYVMDNKSFGLGGVLEGAQTMAIAQYLQSSDFQMAHKISSIHTFGLSLGGNSALITSLLSDFNRKDNGTRLIQSSFALCPVVNLEETLESILNSKLQGFFMSKTAWTVIKILFDLDGQPEKKKRPKIEEMHDIVTIEAQKTYKRNADLLKLAPFSDWNFTEPKTFGEANRYSSFLPVVTTPTFVLSAHDDPVVPPKVNSVEILNKYKNRYSTGVHITKDGGHCAQSIAYGWDTISTIVKEFFLNFSPEFKTEEAVIPFNLDRDTSRDLALKKSEVHFSQTWASIGNQLELTFNIWSPGRHKSCLRTKPTKAPKFCFRRVVAIIDDPKLDLVSHGSTESITRWANTNLSVLDQNKQPLGYSRKSPAYLAHQN